MPRHTFEYSTISQYADESMVVDAIVRPPIEDLSPGVADLLYGRAGKMAIDTIAQVAATDEHAGYTHLAVRTIGTERPRYTDEMSFFLERLEGFINNPPGDDLVAIKMLRNKSPVDRDAKLAQLPQNPWER